MDMAATTLISANVLGLQIKRRFAILCVERHRLMLMSDYPRAVNLAVTRASMSARI